MENLPGPDRETESMQGTSRRRSGLAGCATVHYLIVPVQDFRATLGFALWCVSDLLPKSVEGGQMGDCAWSVYAGGYREWVDSVDHNSFLDGGDGCDGIGIID